MSSNEKAKVGDSLPDAPDTGAGDPDGLLTVENGEVEQRSVEETVQYGTAESDTLANESVEQASDSYPGMPTERDITGSKPEHAVSD